MAIEIIPKFWLRGEGIDPDNPRVIKGVQWAEENFDEIVEISPKVWLVPKGSAPGCYIIDDSEEEYKCNCPYSKHTGKLCKHYYAMRFVQSRTRRCAVCQRRHRSSEMLEIVDCEHPALYPGDRVCDKCAVREGVA